ncbi:MAG: TetR/AcrR family transcriptional regulator [Lachnospiraceae bacterium]|nr:TetR/AcrR family transcriptional regulator [Lachnospiraceae bacterium]
MNSKFFDLAKEKQDRMINAALKVFAQNGYKGASTDDIVKEAGISKGLLFHYFVSKLGLYTFIFDYSTRYMTLELTTTVDKEETELFEIYKQMEFAKMHALKNYPYMQEFLNSTVYEDVNEALLAIEGRRNALTKVYEDIYSQMDTEHFKPEVDVNKLQRILDLTMKGIMEEHFREGSFQPEMLFKEVTGYLDMMRALTVRV